MMELERNAEFLRGVGINEAKPRIANLPVLTDLSPELRPTGDYLACAVFCGNRKVSYRALWLAHGGLRHTSRIAACQVDCRDIRADWGI